MNPIELLAVFLLAGIAIGQLISIADSLRQIGAALRDISNSRK